MAKQALLLIDIQQDYFPGGENELEGMEAATQKAKALLEASRAAKLPVIHVRHEFPTTEAPFFKQGSPGTDINEAVRPIDGEPVITKQHVNAFRETQSSKSLLSEQGIQSLTYCWSNEPYVY